MTRRGWEIVTLVGLTVLLLVWYLGAQSGIFKPIVFSTTVSLIISALIGLSLVWVLVRTIRGKLVDRRIVFLYVGVAVAIPLFMSIGQTITISPEVQSLYDGLEELAPGSKVLVSFDYDPPSAAELQPMAETFLKYAFDHQLKLIIIGLWPQGPQQANAALAKVLEDEKYKAMNLQYGTDYVNLGFQSGNEFVIQRMGSSFQSMFPVDFRGTRYENIPLTQNVRNFSNVDYVFNLSSGYVGTKEWVLVGVDRYGITMGAGNTAVQVTEMYPYVRSGQIKGILGGMNGAAEFEKITGKIGKGTRFMLSQSFSHLVVIAFILIGNVAYFRIERKKG